MLHAYSTIPGQIVRYPHYEVAWEMILLSEEVESI